MDGWLEGSRTSAPSQIQIAFLEICFSLTALIGFRMVYVTFSRHIKHKLQTLL